MKLEVDLETRTWVTQTADPTDRWDRDNTNSELTDLSVYEVDEEACSHEFELDGVEVGDPVYVVVATYSTGDTFGRSDGQVEVMDIFADAKTAYELVDALADDESETITKNGRRIETKYEAVFQGQNYYKPWMGYFEYLQSIDVKRSWVQRAQKERRYW